MLLNDLAIGSLAVIDDMIITDNNEQNLVRLMVMGVVPGLEIRKLSSVQTCSEYKIEGTSGRIVINKSAGDYIIVEEIEDDY